MDPCQVPGCDKPAATARDTCAGHRSVALEASREVTWRRITHGYEISLSPTTSLFLSDQKAIDFAAFVMSGAKPTAPAPRRHPSPAPTRIEPMSLPDFLFDRHLLQHLTGGLVHSARMMWPDRTTTIGTSNHACGVLADRYVVARDASRCIYVHRWLRSDPDELHDHPWDSCSLVLTGGYYEVTREGRFWRQPGDVTFRRAEDRHRIEIDIERAVHPVSLFITGPERRDWGFWLPRGDGGEDFVIGREYRQGPSKEITP